MDITVENITSDSPASKTAGEDSVISSETNHSPNAFHAFPSPVDAPHIDNRARALALDSSASKISIDTASTVPNADHQTMNASYVSAASSLTVFAESVPASTEGRLVPPPFLRSLQSRLATEGERSVSTVLTVAWWQPILMRVLPLTSMSTVVNYRLQTRSTTSYLKTPSWWQEILTKNASADQINRVCGDYRLVYLRTTEVSNVGQLKSSLRRHWLFRRYCILAIFPFATNLWETLVARNYVGRFIKCVEGCGYVVEENVRPGHPVRHLLDVWRPCESCLRARERLIGRASIARLASGDSEFASGAATIYRDLVKLYRCSEVYNIVISNLLNTDQPPYPPGWSCTVGFSQYPTNNEATEEHCE